MSRPWFFALATLAACASSSEDEGAQQHLGTEGAYTLEVPAAVAGAIDVPFVRREIEASITLYRREVAAPRAPIAVVVDAPECLRTGYDMASRTVRFCNNETTPRVGTASADVIHHEMFHALLCQSRPDWCGDGTSADTDRVAMHEGLADYFAYLLAPDEAFGEGFYRDRPIVRRYRVAHCYSLVGGGHEKGNAIVSALVAAGRGLADVRRLVEGGELTLASLFADGAPDACLGASPPQIARTVTGYPASTLERYRVEPGAPLTLRFEPDPAFEARYASLAVRWEPAPPRFTITGLDATTFRVEAVGTSGFDKVTALYVADGEVVGGKNFYFQIARP